MCSLGLNHLIIWGALRDAHVGTGWWGCSPRGTLEISRFFEAVPLIKQVGFDGLCTHGEESQLNPPAELNYLSANRQKRVAGIYSMSVDEARRRQGIGASLVNYLMTQSSEHGVEEIVVGTTVENRAARRTYEKGGMRPIAFRTGTMYRYPE